MLNVCAKAIDHCNNPNDATGQGDTTACPYLTVIDATKAEACKINPIVNEATGGVLAKLPGSVTTFLILQACLILKYGSQVQPDSSWARKCYILYNCQLPHLKITFQS